MAKQLLADMLPAATSGATLQQGAVEGSSDLHAANTGEMRR